MGWPNIPFFDWRIVSNPQKKRRSSLSAETFRCFAAFVSYKNSLCVHVFLSTHIYTSFCFQIFATCVPTFRPLQLPYRESWLKTSIIEPSHHFDGIFHEMPRYPHDYRWKPISGRVSGNPSLRPHFGEVSPVSSRACRPPVRKPPQGW